MRLLIPGVLISLSSLVTRQQCGRIPQSKDVPGMPPSWVFGVVWPVLYITTGMAWARSKNDQHFATIIALACLWLFVYSCKKDNGLSALILLVTTVLSWNLVHLLRGDARRLFLPFAMWITFATYLNTFSAIREESTPAFRRLPGASS